jgi:cysteinyl-tRNA synthetase
MVNLDREKMAKSAGNIFMLHEALSQYGRDALIVYFCAGHYRQPLDFDHDRLNQARANVTRLREAARRLAAGPSPSWSGALRERFFAALAEDFNTPAALAVVFDWVREANRARGDGAGAVGDADLRAMLAVLGLENLLERAETEASSQVVELLDRRERARKAGDYQEADRIRARIAELGWEVRDSPSGPELLPARR